MAVASLFGSASGRIAFDDEQHGLLDNEPKPAEATDTPADENVGETTTA